MGEVCSDNGGPAFEYGVIIPSGRFGVSSYPRPDMFRPIIGPTQRGIQASAISENRSGDLLCRYRQETLKRRSYWIFWPLDNSK